MTTQPALHILHREEDLRLSALYRTLDDIAARHSSHSAGLIRAVAERYNIRYLWQFAALHIDDIYADGIGTGTVGAILGAVRNAGLTLWPEPIDDADTTGHPSDLIAVARERMDAIQAALDRRLAITPASPETQPTPNDTEPLETADTPTPPEPPMACALCDQPLASRQGHYNYDGNNICPRCWSDAAAQRIRSIFATHTADEEDRS